MLELFTRAMKSGWHSSEFWLSVAAVVLPVATDQASKLHGTAGIVAAAVIAGAYSVSRGLVKAKTVEASGPAAASEAAALAVDGVKYRSGEIVR